MRQTFTLLTCAMLAATIPAVARQTPPAPAALDPAKIERGIKVYAAQRCSSCHSIDGQGNRRYPLDGVGTRLERDTIRLWIVAPQKVDPRVRKRAFDRLSPEDLDGLVTYMLSLKERP